jgi:hypothetical protein
MPVEPSIKWVPLEHVAELKTGDIIHGRLSGDAYVVTGQYGGRATAVRTVDVTNPNEWMLMRPVQPAGDEHG